MLKTGIKLQYKNELALQRINAEKLFVNLFAIITIGTFSAKVSFTHILGIISQQV